MTKVWQIWPLKPKNFVFVFHNETNFVFCSLNFEYYLAIKRVEFLRFHFVFATRVTTHANSFG